MTDQPTSDDLRDLIRTHTTSLRLAWTDQHGTERTSVYRVTREDADQIDADASKRAL